MVEIQTNVVYDHLENCDTDIIVEQGGTRSGKTYNILLWLILQAKSGKWQNTVVDIVRKSFPSLRVSAMFDFFQILERYGWYEQDKHNRTNSEYKIGTNTFRFFSCDDSQKMRGPGRDVLFCNEANELTLEEFRQLNMRTRKFTILDFNPSMEFHWIYDVIIPRENCTFHRTTYLDNPFLDKRIIREIQTYKDTDPNFWRIYGLGERGISQTTIYPNWDTCKKIPENVPVYYGLDFGFNHPTALTRVSIHENCLYIEELLYERYLTIPDIIIKLRELSIPKTATIYADNARPEAIEEIYRAGFNIHPCIKGPDSVKQGIDFVKRHKIFIHEEATNILKEIKSYQWKVDKEERVLDEPVKVNDDGVDSFRYALSALIDTPDEFGILEGSFF